jgi:sterol desaturase/sphingolipid hydroxylase (fatty acid hydroxylase superfamily)
MKSIVVAAVAGTLTWSFLEYVIHRWLGHDRRFRRNLFAVEHIRHHVEGNYFAPGWKKGIAASVVAAALGVPALLLGGAVGLAWVGGLLAFYGTYEALHRFEHVRPSYGPYGRWARRHHFTHHFVDGRCNHGVTSPLWDFVFGTYRRPGRIVVPPKLAMSWLVDPRTGRVRAEWADTFELR